MKKINYPDGYRYTCPMEEFKKYVDIAEELLKKDKLSIVFGCTEEVKLQIWMTEEECSNDYEELSYARFCDVIYSEVAYLIEQSLKQPEEDDPSLEAFLQECDIDLEDKKNIVCEKKEKRNYVADKLVNEEMIPRFIFKNRTLNEKLYDLNFEINKFIFRDDTDMVYSTLEFSTASVIKNRGIPSLLTSDNNVKRIKFVCDKQDIDFIIKRLENIRERL